MISSMIVFVSIVMAIVFAAFYIKNADFRKRVEQPKHQFMEQLAQYDSGKESQNER